MTQDSGILLTQSAIDKVRALIQQESEEGLALRIAVEPGGCSGLKYQFFFDTNRMDSDTVTRYDGFDLVIDDASVKYLIGATVDYQDSISKQGFTIDNPNAQNCCACGDSFC